MRKHRFQTRLSGRVFLCYGLISCHNIRYCVHFRKRGFFYVQPYFHLRVRYRRTSRQSLRPDFRRRSRCDSRSGSLWSCCNNYHILTRVSERFTFAAGKKLHIAKQCFTQDLSCASHPCPAVRCLQILIGVCRSGTPILRA